MFRFVLGDSILGRVLTSYKHSRCVIRKLSEMSSARPSVAVVLSGCGVYDGAEIHEASAVMVGLSRQNASYQIYAPNKQQMHVINHTNGEEMKETRNVLVESARIARGNIKPLSELDVNNHHAVIFPGGFGAAKNLCDFAVKQTECAVDDEVIKVVEAFHKGGKPIGLCCIAPVIAAKILKGCEVTVGMDTSNDSKWPYAGTAGAIGAMGSKHVNKNVNEVHVDTNNKVVTTPAFMCETAVHEIHDGVSEMVKEVIKLL